MITVPKPNFRPLQMVANLEAAETLALQTLAYVLEDPERASRFLQVTGLVGMDLATQLDNPAFLGGVLDFVLENDILLEGAAGAAGLPPEAVRIARRQLPGLTTED
jgi:hypothetical protein